MSLPLFDRSAHDEWVTAELNTARLIRALWANATAAQRRDPDFIAVLVQCGWTNVRNGVGLEATRKWRNDKIAQYLGVPLGSESQLAKELKAQFPRLDRPFALLKQDTGFTRYYDPFRPSTLRFVRRHADLIAKAFALAATRKLIATAKVALVLSTIAGLPLIRCYGKTVSVLNGITATLACLDPLQRFPVMNKRTLPLLRFIGEQPDERGALALCNWIDRNEVGVRNSFELDVYSLNTKFPPMKHQPIRWAKGEFRDVGIKSELAGFVYLTTNRVRIRRLHNRLTNKLYEYLKGRRGTLKEREFDVVIPHWMPGRHLLIEAKTASVGPGGRAQIRQAIGQLFDYRFSYFGKNDRIDLAILLPSQPPADVQSLLKSLQIEALWFEGSKQKGSVRL
jgi:hypothetical protein